MAIEQYDLWLADFNLREGFNKGNERPVCVLQTNLLVDHPSTLIAPLTSHIKSEIHLLRIHVIADEKSGLEKSGDIMMDQIRTIDNTRLVRKIGNVQDKKDDIKESIRVVFDIDM